MSVNPAPTTMSARPAPLEWHGLGAAAESFAPLIGRILLSMIFLLSAVHKVMDWSGTEAQMAAKGMPAVPFFLTGAFLLEALGSLSLLLGFRARIGALFLIVFLLGVTPVMHDFWHYQGEMRMMQQMNFIKNSAIMGGLFLALAFGSGRYSMDRCCR